MARKTTIAKFQEWIAAEGNEASVLELIAGGLTLQKASVSVKQPYTCLHEWFHRAENEPRYLAARKAWADAKQDEAIALVEGVKPDRDHVAKVKLQAEVYANQAKAYHRERWGEKVQVEKSVSVLVDAGPATRLLRELQQLEEKVVPALPAPVGVESERG